MRSKKGLFALWFETNVVKTGHRSDGCNFFLKPVGNIIIKNDNIRKFTTGQGDGYTNLKENYKIIAKALSKQQALDGADPS